VYEVEPNSDEEDLPEKYAPQHMRPKESFFGEVGTFVRTPDFPTK
jgi:hypothetical protein